MAAVNQAHAPRAESLTIELGRRVTPATEVQPRWRRIALPIVIILAAAGLLWFVNGHQPLEQWLFWQSIHLGPAMQTVGFERVVKPHFELGAPDQALIDSKLTEAYKFLQVFERGLGRRAWIVDELSVADFALASTFMYRKPADISLAKFPAVDAWIQRLEARDSWRRAVAPFVDRMGL